MDYFAPGRTPLHRGVASHVRLWRLPDVDDCSVYVVDGELLRAEVDIDFALGGNGGRYRYVPIDELWVEDTGSFADIWHTVQHESRERALMIDGASYDEAHELASRAERRDRRRGQRNPDNHEGQEETVEQIVAHKHYGFWLSPHGECYVVDRSWDHEDVAISIAKRLRLDEWSAELELEKRGWARAAGLPTRFALQYGIDVFSGDWHEPTQRQIDTMFDLQQALPPGNAQNMVKTLVSAMLSPQGMYPNPPTTILTLCCSCETVIVDAPPGPSGEVSHGLCPDCIRKMAIEYGLTADDLLHILEEQKPPAHE